MNQPAFQNTAVRAIGSNQPPPAPTELSDAVSAVDSQILALDNLIVQLHVRMEPVLRSAPPSANGGMTPNGSPMVSPLTVIMQGQCATLTRLTMQVGDILDRLAV